MSGHYVHIEISIADPGHTKIGETIIMQYSPRHPSDDVHLQEIQAVVAIVKNKLRNMDFREPPDIRLGGAAAHEECSKGTGEIDTEPEREKAIEVNYLIPPEQRRLSQEQIDDARASDPDPGNIANAQDWGSGP